MFFFGLAELIEQIIYNVACHNIPKFARNADMILSQNNFVKINISSSQYFLSKIVRIFCLILISEKLSPILHQRSQQTLLVAELLFSLESYTRGSTDPMIYSCLCLRSLPFYRALKSSLRMLPCRFAAFSKHLE